MIELTSDSLGIPDIVVVCVVVVVVVVVEGVERTQVQKSGHIALVVCVVVVVVVAVAFVVCVVVEFEAQEQVHGLGHVKTAPRSLNNDFTGIFSIISLSNNNEVKIKKSQTYHHQSMKLEPDRNSKKLISIRIVVEFSSNQNNQWIT